MTVNRVTIFLTALCTIFSMSALPSFAISEPTCEVEEDNGYLSVILERGRYDGILVETDGTVLTEDMVNTLDGYTSLMTWDEYKGSIEYWAGWSKTETSVNPEENGYMISTGALDDETLLAIGRKLMLEQECITNIYLVEYAIHAQGILGDCFYVTPISSDVTLDETSISELSDFRVSYYPEMFDFYTYDLCDSTSFYSDFERNDETTDYDEYKYWLDYANMLMENHGDILASVEVSVGHNESNYSKTTPTSIWHTAGDPNADGEVTAADASDMLMTAAKLGAGADADITSAEDVNADGTVDAQDAAAVLTYAAAQGSGNPLSWVEILR